MKIFKEMFMSREEKTIREKRKNVSNAENPPIATDVELIVNHSVWQSGKEKKVFGQGQLHLVIDGDPGPEPLPAPKPVGDEPPEKEKEQPKKKKKGKKKPPKNPPKPKENPEVLKRKIENSVPPGYRKKGLSVYRIGSGMNVLVPSFMGTHFMKQGKFSQTHEGKKRIGRIMMALLALSYLFLFYYLPKSHEINESDMITGHYAQLIYLASFLIGFFGWWFGKKTTANRIKLQCFDPRRCDLHDIHVGIFTCSKYTPEQQIAWWTNTTTPRDSINTLNQDLMKQNRSYQQEIVKLIQDVDVYRLLGDEKAIMKLKREGFLMKDDGMVLFFRRATFLLSIGFLLFLLYWYIGGV